jgi:hypothetical protein
MPIQRMFLRALLLVLVAWALAPTAGARTAPAPHPPARLSPGVEPTWQCWYPGDVQPCMNSPVALDMLSSTEGWAVGQVGMILHWDGFRWLPVASPIVGYMDVIDTLSPDNAWAANSDGYIIHWDGQAWTSMGRPTGDTTNWSGASFVSATDGWISGSYGGSGVLLRWTGAGWVRYSVSSEVFVVKALAPDNAWAAGHGYIQHWDGSAWSAVPEAGYGVFRSIDALGPDDIWLVGDGRLVTHWDGANWRNYTPPTPTSDSDFYAVSILAADDVWVGGGDGTTGQGFVLHWDGQSWTMTPVFNGNGISDLVMVSAHDGWALAGGSYAMLRWDGQSWRVVSSRRQWGLGRTQFLAANDGWGVAGTYTSGMIVRWDGRTWQQQAWLPVNYLAGLAVRSTTDGWAIGGYGYTGSFFHWDGQTWTQTTGPISDTVLQDLVMFSPIDGWAVGGGVCFTCQDTGKIFRWDGNSWQFFQGAVRYLWAVDGAAPDDVWAVGQNGLILHWDGANWTSVASPTTVQLRALSVRSATDVWAVGGRVFHWDGQTWSVAPNTPNESFYDIAAVGPDEVWLAGSSGLIVHGQAGTWTYWPRMTDSDLAYITMLSPTEGWISGGSRILRYTSTPPSWLRMVYFPAVLRLPP